MGFFNQNDFKYIIKRIIIILGVLIIASMFKKVFGFTNWTAPNNKTYRIPDYTVPSGEKFITYVRQNKNNNYFRVFYLHTNGDYLYLQPISNGYYLKIRSLPYNSSTEVFSGNYTYSEQYYESQSLPGNSTFTSTTTNTVSNYANTWNTNTYDYYVYDANFDLNVYTTNPVKNDYLSTFYDYQDPTVEPYIENSSTDIESWSFDNLSINYGTFTYDSRDFLRVTYFDSVTGENFGDFDLNLSFYADTINNGSSITTINIPQQRLNNSIVFKDTFKIGFILVHFTDNIGNADTYPLSDSPYTVSISTTYADDLNNNADRTIQNDILNESQKTNSLIGDLNNNLTSSDIDDNAINFPTVDVQDGGVLNAMASFFDKIYNAFTNGTLLDIVIPIPFTNRNITIPYDYTETQLRNANASWIIDIIQLGWWYIIGRYIILNLFEKVIMLMRGSVERVQMTNITTKLL